MAFLERSTIEESGASANRSGAIEPLTLADLYERAATAVEALLALLDRLDGDPDLEPYLTGSANEREGPEDDLEPSLGSLDRQSQLRSYATSAVGLNDPDLEGDGNGR